MSTSDTLKKALAELREQAENLRQELKETANAIDAIERLVAPPDQRAPKPTEPSVPELKGASWADAAEWVLRRTGQPQHSEEIVRQLQEAGYRANEDPKKLKLSLVGAVARNARKGERFDQMGDGMYALKEWGFGETPQEQGELEPE